MASFASYFGKGILIDSNILLLLVVGAYKQSLIGTDRLANFSVRDYELLLRMLSRFKPIVTTPHILTEVNNLAFSMVKGRYRDGVQTAFLGVIQWLHEERMPAMVIGERRAFLPLGLTDAAISLAAEQAYLVLTDDGPLYAFLAGQGLDAVNFNHLRTAQ